MIRYIFSVTLFSLFAINAVAQGGGMGGPEERVFIPDVDEESFIWQVPDKWYPYSKTSDEKIDTFIFPTGQNPEKWREALHFVDYTSTLGVTDASQVYEIRTQGSAANCAEHEVEQLRQQPENGYSMVQWSEKCELANGDTTFTINKAVVGNEKLYTVAKIWKSEPRERNTERWYEYLNEVYVCDPRTDANPCRPPNGPPGGDERPRR